MNKMGYELLLDRRSVRKFQKTPVSRETIELLIQAGQYAPSAKNCQSVCFIAIQNPKVRDEIARLNARVIQQNNPSYAADPFYGAPLLIAVLASGSQPTWVANGAVALENILLAAQALDLGACWIHRAQEVFNMPEGKRMMEEWGIPADYRGVGFAAIGYPASLGDKPGKRLSIVRIVL